MRLLVLSDTHARAERVPQVMAALAPHLAHVDLVLHAGDMVAPAMLEALEAHATVYAVRGNMDGPDLAHLPEQTVLDLGGHRIGLIHGWGAPNDLERRVFERFSDREGRPTVEALVFGHSHQALVTERQGVLLLNPGSPTDRRFAPYLSFGLLELGERLEAEIVRL